MKTWTFAEVRPPGVGPWNDEPDKAQWIDEATGYDCLIIRHPQHGNLNGYVAVPAGHPAFGKDYNDVDIDVHGGLTYAAYTDSQLLGDSLDAILTRVPAEGRPADVWWFGFDCHHARDLAPTFAARMAAIPGMPAPIYARDEYRTFAYVVLECESLARQLAAMS